MASGACLHDALQRVPIAVSAFEDEGAFDRLAGDLAGILAVDIGFIAVFADASRTEMRMLAFWLDGRVRKPFTYPLEGTPCASVVGRQFRYVSGGAREEFPRDDLFAKLGLESYAAYPLNDSTGQPLGLIGAMHRGTLPAGELCEAVLKMFAVRVAGELAVAALRASEEQYRAIFHATADSMVLRDADFRVV